jgi:phosphatidylinositol alpha-1,6-mannosyltransferase
MGLTKRVTLIVTSDFPPTDGGIARLASELADALHRNGEEIVVLTTSKTKGIPGSQQQQELRVIRTGWGNVRLLRYLSLFMSLCRILLTYKVGRIHALIWFPDGVASMLASGIFRTPYFVSTYAADISLGNTPLKRYLLKRLMLLVLSRAKKITAISHYTKAKLTDYGVNPQKIVIIPGGTDAERFNPEVDATQVIQQFNLLNKKVIMTIGRLEERKGHDMVMKSLIQVLGEVPEAVYLIVGKGQELSRLKEMVTELELDGHVIFAGYVEEERLVEYYNACDVFIMPSREITAAGDAEGYGIVYLEANACGKPAIGGKSGGIPDAIVNGYNGILVDPLSTEEIADSLIELLRDEHLAKEMGMNGRRRVLNELSWDAIAEKHQKLYTGEC